MTEPDPGAADPGAAGIRYRRPTETDYRAVAKAMETWWDERRPGELLPRLWFRHFAGTSWVAEDGGGGRVVGILAGFLSPGDPSTAVVQAVAVDPARRRRGVGRTLVERFVGDARGAGAARVEALSWPGNRRAIRFLAALDFEPESGPQTRPLFGTSAYEGYDFDTEDRARFVREL